MGKPSPAQTQGSVQTIQPQLPPIPGLATAQQQGANRAAAGAPYLDAPYRAMDYLANFQPPTSYQPQFTPPGQQAAGAGSPGGGGGASPAGPNNMGVSSYQPPQGQSPGGIPGFYNPMGLGAGMQMPQTAGGTQALQQNLSPGLAGMMSMLSQAFQPSPQQGQGQPIAPATGGQK